MCVFVACADAPPEETVGLIVWSAAEIAVTMVCIGIPVCRPLYKRWLEKFASNLSGTNSGYKKHGSSSRGPRYGLRTIGGSTMPGATQWYVHSRVDSPLDVSHIRNIQGGRRRNKKNSSN